jgi:hypothetical protein
MLLIQVEFAGKILPRRLILHRQSVSSGGSHVDDGRINTASGGRKDNRTLAEAKRGWLGYCRVGTRVRWPSLARTQLRGDSSFFSTPLMVIIIALLQFVPPEGLSALTRSSDRAYGAFPGREHPLPYCDTCVPARNLLRLFLRFKTVTRTLDVSCHFRRSHRLGSISDSSDLCLESGKSRQQTTVFRLSDPESLLSLPVGKQGFPPPMYLQK